MTLHNMYPAHTDKTTDIYNSIHEFASVTSSVVSVLRDGMSSVINLYKDILRAVEDLATCLYTSEAFLKLLAKIQVAVSPVMPCHLGLND
jgi:hypothetical protein